MIKKFKQYIKEVLSYEDIDDQFLRLMEIYRCDVSYYITARTRVFGFFPKTDSSLRGHHILNYLHRTIDDNTIYLIRIFKDDQEQLQEIKNELEQIKHRIKGQFKYHVVLGDTYYIRDHYMLRQINLDGFASDAGDSMDGIIDYSMMIIKKR